VIILIGIEALLLIGLLLFAFGVANIIIVGGKS
jgi:hypothetical protein